MNSRNEAKLNMYRTVQQLCNNNNSLISGNTAFLDAFNLFSDKISGILSTITAESEVITGIAIDKSVAKSNLCQIAADVAAIIFAYATSIGNNTLKQVVNFTFSDLMRQKDDILVPVCRNIYNAADDNGVALLPFGITPAMYAALGTSMDNYSVSVPKPGTAKSVKKTFTANLRQLVKDADAVLKDQMDKIVSVFKPTDPDFVSSYKNARSIIDPRKTKRIPQVAKIAA